MKRRLWFVIIVSFTSLGFYNLFVRSGENGQETIRYVLSIDETSFEFFKIKIVVENTTHDRLIFHMPRWSPGAYRIRNYADYVTSIAASDKNGRRLNIQKVGEDSWQVVVGGKHLVLEYQVEPAYETWSQVALDSNYALVEGPDVFMYAEGLTDLPITIEYRVPSQWQVASPLQPQPAENTFRADNYDVLIDSPAQLGNFSRYKFDVNDVPIELVFHGGSHFNVDSFLVMVEKICDYQVDFFQEIPFDRYVFFYKLLPGRGGGGGLEHANSTTIGLSSERLALNVMSAAEVTAHEFFHVWNVKRIRPKVLETIDYTTEERTDALWFSEGVTSYYEALTLLRAGLWNSATFLNEMERQIEQLQETGDRHATSVEDASRYIWERGYLHSGISFYNKGELLGLLLDLKMRHVTGNRASLDEVMRFMNWWFAKRDLGFEEHDIEAAVSSLSHHDFSAFFEDYVAGTHELPFTEILVYAGLETDIQTSWVPSLGDVIFVGPRNRLVYLETDSPMFTAGVRRNDYLLQVDGVDVVSLSQFEEVVSRLETGSKTEIKVLTGEEEKLLAVTVGQQEVVDCEIEPLANAGDQQLAIRRGWLEGWTGLAPNNGN